MKQKEINEFLRNLKWILENGIMPKDNVNWAQAQKEMGCPACRFADKKKLGKGPCCTHYQGPTGNPCTREADRVAAEKGRSQES